MTECPIAVAELADFAEQAFVAVDVPTDIAHRTARYLVRADARGVHTHGLDLLPYYCDGLAEGGLDPHARPHVVHEFAATAIVDGANGLGYETARIAVDEACARADRYGVGVAVARNSNHFGMAAHWTLQAVDRGLIGFATTNGPPVMAVHGADTVTISNNPISWAIPAGHQPPIVLDFANTAASRGALRLAVKRGEAIPDTWALGPDGAPTTDPRAALAGVMLPFAAHKGSGLAVIGEVLASSLSAALALSAVSTASMNAGEGHGAWHIGHFFLTLAPAAFGSPEEFRQRVDAISAELSHAAPAPGFDRVTLPGQGGHEREESAARHGVTLPTHTVRKLQRYAAKAGLKFPK